MRIRKKLVLIVLSVFFIIFSINLFFNKSNREELKGEIVIWTNDLYYTYFLEIANEFIQSNKKVDIEVVSIGKDDYLNRIMNTNEKSLPNIVQLDFMEIDMIKDKIDFIEENKYIIDTYNKNFNDSRLQQVEINENYYGVPFESKPIALYVRSDILSNYGFEVSQLNTWNDLLRVGSEIKSKTAGEINLFSVADKNNIELLVTAQLVDNKDTKYTKVSILEEISKIYNNEFVTEDSNYLFRIASIDFYKDITEGNIAGIWGCKNPPSYSVGENKFYDLGGKSLVALNVDKNREAIKAFIAFASTNKELLSEELLDNKFFPSSLYSLNIKQKESEIVNIEGSSPFLILSNIVERAPIIKDYDRLKEMLYN
ncbi:ABC transporter substrate-binding protein [Clostridium sp. AL.422]|uniref:ABC transporter substrate-binding protein n=1 Tax=Clostridium TaxID=1485 RepID=UPI00293DD0BE|nr:MULTISPECIES: ABC transporter substrate-binding protein [unclassified Clostridium]MDV4149516.1 ABC transporter substrate-binding protein [Clostridium sp. AL.422]